MYHFELRPFRNNSWNSHSEWDKELEKFFDVFSKADYYAPPCEIIDEEKFYSISLDVPGVSREELQIEVKDDHLHVTGERKPQREEQGKVLRSERKWGKFSRVFTLPQGINLEAIEAKFENGVLDIHLPKEEKSTSKKIVISNWSSKNDSGFKS